MTEPRAMPAGAARRTDSDPPPVRRRILGWLYRHPRFQVLAVLGPPVGWFGVVYFGSLALLLVTAFSRLDPLTNQIVHQFGLSNFFKIIQEPIYATIARRTLGIAVAVTVVDAMLAFPIAWYMARVAGTRTRALLFMSVLLPLWASYLVRVYAWRVILSDNGLLDWVLERLGLGSASQYFGISDLSMAVVFCYLWLPYMILPLYAGLERIPNSYFEASEDLGARGMTTFRRITLPLVMPALAAGSIFTFSLTLGDYIAPQLVSNTQFIGNVVYTNVGVAGDIPFAAAYSLVPIAIIGVYLLIVRRLGAFEAI